MNLELWNTPPTLSGRYVMLRPTVQDDLHGLTMAHDDNDTLQYFPYGIESTPPSAESLEYALRSGRQVLTQIDISTGRIIGTTSLYNVSKLHRRVTIGFTWFSKAVRGTMFNLESKLLLLEYVFDSLGATRVELNVDDLNVRSRHAVLALGAKEEGYLRKHARRRDGSWRTTVVYSVIDDDWPAVRANIEDRISLRSSVNLNSAINWAIPT